MKMIALAAAATLIGGQALAGCPASNIIGTWDDSFGSVAKITSTTAGTATASSAVCNNPKAVYKLNIHVIGTVEAKVVATVAKSTGCPSPIKATLKYAANSCSSASGPLILPNGTQIPDTWTKVSGAASRPAGNSSLQTGLK